MENQELTFIPFFFLVASHMVREEIRDKERWKLLFADDNRHPRGSLKIISVAREFTKMKNQGLAFSLFLF